jgi:hypothetical protein
MKTGEVSFEEYKSRISGLFRSYLPARLMKQGDSICITIPKPYAIREDLKKGDRVEVAFYWQPDRTDNKVLWFIYEQELSKVNTSLVAFVPAESNIIQRIKQDSELNRNIDVSFAKFHKVESKSKEWKEATAHGTRYNASLNFICPYCGVENKDFFDLSPHNNTLFITGDVIPCQFCDKEIEARPILKYKKK